MAMLVYQPLLLSPIWLFETTVLSCDTTTVSVACYLSKETTEYLNGPLHNFSLSIINRSYVVGNIDLFVGSRQSASVFVQARGVHSYPLAIRSSMANTKLTCAAIAARATSTRPNTKAGDQHQTRLIAAASRAANVRRFFSFYYYFAQIYSIRKCFSFYEIV